MVRLCNSSASCFSLMIEMPDALKIEVLSRLNPQGLQQFSLASRTCNILANDAMYIKYMQLAQYLIPRLNSDPLNKGLESLQNTESKQWKQIKAFLLQALDPLPSDRLPALAAASAQFPHFHFLTKIHKLLARLEQLLPVPEDPYSRAFIQAFKLNKICIHLTDNGLFDKALETASNNPIIELKAKSLNYIIQNLPDLQKIDRARALTQTSFPLKFPCTLAGIFQSGVLRHIAIQYAAHHELPRAIEMIATIYHQSEKAAALRAIAAMPLTDVEIEPFLEMAFSLSDSAGNRTLALSGFVKRHFEHGQISTAFTLLNKMGSWPKKSQLLQTIAERAPHVNCVEHVHALAKEMESVLDIECTLEAISKAFADFNQIAQALDVLESDPLEKSKTKQMHLRALRYILPRISDLDNLERAERLYHRVSLQPFYSAQQSDTLIAVAEQYAALGNLSRAIELATSIPSDNPQKLGLLATLVSHAKNLEQLSSLHIHAKECYSKSKFSLSSHTVSHAFQKIAEKYTDFEKIQEALEALKAVNEVTKGETLAYITSRLTTLEHFDAIICECASTYSKSEARSALVKKLAAFGKFSRALGIAAAIPQEEQRFNAIADIARGQIHREGLEKVRAFASTLPAKQQECILWGLSEKEADGGEWIRAKEIASSLQIKYLQSKALAYVAKKCADQHLCDLALSLIPSISNKDLQTETLQHIACKYADAGYIEKALAIIPSLPENHRGLPLSHIASQLLDLQHMETILSLTETLLSARDRERVFPNIAAKFAECGAIGAALQLAHTLVAYYKAQSYQKIAYALCKEKQFDEALDIIHSLRNSEYLEFEKRCAMGVISRSLADDGHFEKAEEVAYAIHTAGVSSSASETARCFRHIHKRQRERAASSSQ